VPGSGNRTHIAFAAPGFEFECPAPHCPAVPRWRSRHGNRNDAHIFLRSVLHRTALPAVVNELHGTTQG
jgi:hypothetical protein